MAETGIGHRFRRGVGDVEHRRFEARVILIAGAERAIGHAGGEEDALDRLEQGGERFDIVVLLEPTSPLRDVSDIDGAVRRLVGTPGAESVVGIAMVEGAHPAFLMRESGAFLEPYASRPPTGVRRQDLEPLFHLEGSVYASYVPALRARRSFYHDRTVGWRVSRYKALEIDELPDLIACEALLAARDAGRMG